MKKILFALALFASMQFGYAQSKAAADAIKAVQKAEAAANDAKKATKASTWVKLGQAYLNAYNVPILNVVGTSKQELSLVMQESPVSVETVTIGGQRYEKQVFAEKNLYFNGDGVLQITEVTKPVYEEDILAKAVAAFKKAQEIDPVKTQKDVDAGLLSIAQAYSNDAFSKYQLGDARAASKYFGLAADTYAAMSDHRVDTTSIYYAGVTALEAGDTQEARKYFDRAKSLGYQSEDGSIYANLASVALAQGDTLSAKNYLEDGFAKYPNSGQILTNLINLYIGIKENPMKLISLLDDAKRQMPDNASLYYVEGNVLAQLGKFDDAIDAYHRANQIDSKYEMGFYGEGVLHYSRALALQAEAETLPFNEYEKYDEMQTQIADELRAAIDPFEKAFSITAASDVKLAVAEYLKRVYFIFRNESSQNQSNYEKYNSYLERYSGE